MVEGGPKGGHGESQVVPLQEERVEGCEKGEVVGGLRVESEDPLDHWSSLK